MKDTFPWSVITGHLQICCLNLQDREMSIRKGADLTDEDSKHPSVLLTNQRSIHLGSVLLTPTLHLVKFALPRPLTTAYLFQFRTLHLLQSSSMAPPW